MHEFGTVKPSDNTCTVEQGRASPAVVLDCRPVIMKGRKERAESTLMLDDLSILCSKLRN